MLCVSVKAFIYQQDALAWYFKSETMYIRRYESLLIWHLQAVGKRLYSELYMRHVQICKSKDGLRMVHYP